MALVCLLFAGACMTPETPKTPETFVSLQSTPAVNIAAGSEQTAFLDFEIADGYHILADHGEDTALRFTKLSIEGNDQIQVGEPRFPEPTTYDVSDTDYQLGIFENDLAVSIPLSVREGGAHGKHRLAGTLSYQMCNPKKCFFPRELDFQLEVRVP